jgi:NADPH-dependent curcumin reductase CurA
MSVLILPVVELKLLVAPSCIRTYGRIIACGGISGYNEESPGRTF